MSKVDAEIAARSLFAGEARALKEFAAAKEIPKTLLGGTYTLIRHRKYLRVVSYRQTITGSAP
jgi:hypothetical protein